MYKGSTVQRRKMHAVEKLEGTSDTWRTTCGWLFGKGSKSEMMLPQPWPDIDKSAIAASWCTSGCFTPVQLQDVKDAGGKS